jgi:hypothetical protein
MTTSLFYQEIRGSPETLSHSMMTTYLGFLGEVELAWQREGTMMTVLLLALDAPKRYQEL